MSEEVEEAIKDCKDLIEEYLNCSIIGANMHVDVSFDEKRCKSIEILINHIKELESRKQSTIDLLKYRIADSRQMVEICRKDNDVKMEHFYEGKKLVAEEMLIQIEGEKK